MRIFTLTLPFLHFIFAAGENETYCVRGYVMDTLCIKLGTLLDNPSLRTLSNAHKHSLHCLVDVPDCVASGYQMMVEPKRYQDGDDFVPNVILDSQGNDMVVTAAREVGNCSTCIETGTLVMGFRATVVGMLDAGASPHFEAGMNSTPPTLRVTEVLPYSSECPEISGNSTTLDDSKDSGNSTTLGDSKDSGNSTTSDETKDSGNSTTSDDSNDSGNSTTSNDSNISDSSSISDYSNDSGSSTTSDDSNDSGSSTTSDDSNDSGTSTASDDSKDSGISNNLDETPMSESSSISMQVVKLLIVISVSLATAF